MLTPDLEKKLATVVDKLGAWRTLRALPLETEYTDEVGDRHVLPRDSRSFRPFAEPYYLFREHSYYWFRARFTVPALAPGETAWLSVETFIGGVASTLRPQGLLYLDGRTVAGIDINHTEVPLTPGEHEMYLHFYTHVFGTGLPLYFKLKFRDERINRTYYDYRVALDALRLLEKTDDHYLCSLPPLEKSTLLLDLREPYSPAFYASLEAASAYLAEHYYGALGHSRNRVACIGHTHIDVAWLWNLEQTRQKVERSFATVLALMDEYPEYRFMSSQPQLFAYLKETSPDLYARVKKKIDEGRWEVDGGMWLEADTNLTSGESLVRQLYFGQKFFLDEFGRACTTVWLPDVFGYSGQLPQIMRGSGIERFVTAKIGWNDTDRFPYDAFLWEGIDGSPVFACLLSTCYTDPRTGVYDTTYTSYCEAISPRNLLGTWHRFAQKDYTDTVLMSYGYGDGGGGPTREMLETRRRLANGVPGIPAADIVPLHDALDTIERNFRRNAEELRRTPIWRGELYFEFHRGTLTSVPRVKKHNRMAEIALGNAEGYSAMATLLTGRAYPKQILDDNWRVALLNQFHDILPGSSIEDVYRESDRQYAALFDALHGVTAGALGEIAGNVGADGQTVVFNNTPFTANGAVTAEGKTRIVQAIPAHGYRAVTFGTTACGVMVGERRLTNALYDLCFAEDGSIVSLRDLVSGREIVAPGGRLNRLAVFEDLPYEYDNWEMTPYHRQKEWNFDGAATFTPLDDGDRRGFEIVRRYGQSQVTQRVWLWGEGIPRIDFETSVVWRERGQLLKAVFPFDLLCDTARYEIQFGHVERGTHPNTSWDSARFESVAHKWVDMSEGNYGVALLNDGKYGFGTDGATLTVTLAKCGGFPYPGASDEIPDFTYSLLPHAGGALTDVIREAYVLNNPMTALPGGTGSLPSAFSLVTSDDDGVVVETVKRAEEGDGTVFRLYEAVKGHHTVRLRFGVPVREAWLVNLMEQDPTPVPVTDGTVTLSVKPFEILTLQVK